MLNLIIGVSNHITNYFYNQGESSMDITLSDIDIETEVNNDKKDHILETTITDIEEDVDLMKGVQLEVEKNVEMEMPTEQKIVESSSLLTAKCTTNFSDQLLKIDSFYKSIEMQTGMDVTIKEETISKEIKDYIRTTNENLKFEHNVEQLNLGDKNGDLIIPTFKARAESKTVYKIIPSTFKCSTSSIRSRRNPQTYKKNYKEPY